MLKLNFYLFVGVLEVIVILLIITIIQGFFIKKYRPYFMANTKPELFLRKYLQRLIRQTKHFAKQFSKPAAEGDNSAFKTQQHMTARLNWLVLERDFAITHEPDNKYWEDINNRIKRMLVEWKEIELIKEPPELQIVKLAIDSGDYELDLDNIDLDEAVRDEIKTLKQRISSLSSYEKMYNDMDLAYRTLDQSYNELKTGLNALELEAKEAKKLRRLVEQQEANEANLNAMLDEVEKSKNRLNEELEQLGEAYEALEHEAMEGLNTLKTSDNIEAKDILVALQKQEDILKSLKKTLNNISMKPSQKDKVDKHTDDISKSNKEINHCMQMLELERERLADELAQMQESMIKTKFN